MEKEHKEVATEITTTVTVVSRRTCKGAFDEHGQPANPAEPYSIVNGQVKCRLYQGDGVCGQVDRIPLIFLRGISRRLGESPGLQNTQMARLRCIQDFT